MSRIFLFSILLIAFMISCSVNIDHLASLYSTFDSSLNNDPPKDCKMMCSVVHDWKDCIYDRRKTSYDLTKCNDKHNKKIKDVFDDLKSTPLESCKVTSRVVSNMEENRSNRERCLVRSLSPPDAKTCIINSITDYLYIFECPQ